jgi:hypothetical protein
MSTSGPENRFIQAMHRLLSKSPLYCLKNNNMYNSGIADCWYSGNAADLWVEYKFLELPKRDSTLVDFRDTAKNFSLSRLQQIWLQERFAEGRSVGVIIGTPGGGIWFPGVSWDDAFTAARLRSELQSKQTLADTILRLTMSPT